MFGHVQRLPDTRTVKKIFNCKPLSKISQGSPKYRWEDNNTGYLLKEDQKLDCLRPGSREVETGLWEGQTFQQGSSAPGKEEEQKQEGKEEEEEEIEEDEEGEEDEEEEWEGEE